MASYYNYQKACESGNAEFPKRSIQVIDKQLEEVKQNIKDKSLWSLEVCSKGPPDFDTDLYFYRSNLPNSTKTYKPDAIFGPTIDRYLPPALTKDQISQLEYYNSSFHIGSPFWLNYSGQNKINSIISEHNNELTNLIKQVKDQSQSLSSIQTNAINKTFLSKTLNNLSIDLKAFRDDLKFLHLRYLEIVPVVTKGLNLTTGIEDP